MHRNVLLAAVAACSVAGAAAFQPAPLSLARAPQARLRATSGLRMVEAKEVKGRERAERACGEGRAGKRGAAWPRRSHLVGGA